jgi:hypothetical protein
MVCRSRIESIWTPRAKPVHLLGVKANINGDVGAKTDWNIICSRISFLGCSSYNHVSTTRDNLYLYSNGIFVRPMPLQAAGH